MSILSKTVCNIIDEYKQDHKFSEPRRKLHNKQICDTVEDFDKKAIGRRVHQFFFRKELPTSLHFTSTVIKVLKDVNDEKMKLFCGGEIALKKLNCTYKKVEKFTNLLRHGSMQASRYVSLTVLKNLFRATDLKNLSGMYDNDLCSIMKDKKIQ